MSEASEKNIGRHSKWTSIYWDVQRGEMRPVVRLTPNFLEMERLGFPHGLPVSRSFETEQDAHLYATHVDAFMEAMVREQSADHDLPMPWAPMFARKAAAHLGQLPRWVKIMLSVQWLLTIAAYACMVMLEIDTAKRLLPVVDVAASAIVQLPGADAAATGLRAAVTTAFARSAWQLGLGFALLASLLAGGIVLGLLPSRKRKQQSLSKPD